MSKNGGLEYREWDELGMSDPGPFPGLPEKERGLPGMIFPPFVKSFLRVSGDRPRFLNGIFYAFRSALNSNHVRLSAYAESIREELALVIDGVIEEEGALGKRLKIFAMAIRKVKKSKESSSAPDCLDDDIQMGDETWLFLGQLQASPLEGDLVVEDMEKNPRLIGFMAQLRVLERLGYVVFDPDDEGDHIVRLTSLGRIAKKDT